MLAVIPSSSRINRAQFTMSRTPALHRKHRLIGITLLLPFVTWAVTGIFFLVRPGYQEAYEQIPVRRYELAPNLPTVIDPQWQEIRYFRSVLGNHLLVNTAGQWQHLKAESGHPWPLPDANELQRFLEDAISFNPERYGTITQLQGKQAQTDTGVEIEIHWESATIRQTGRDTRWIDRIYSLHYMEWTGFYLTDRIFGVGMLLLLIYMTCTGARLAFTRHSQANR